ncbi:MAG TPA: metallophosphoesterase [Ignavibacteria bacterium]|nr:metallophosphoesterase [Ignavibacteria bacterium]
MYKIAHISDTHISFNDTNGHGKNLVELLKDIQSRACNHIVITGDLVENPEEKEFRYVKEILSHFDLLHPEKLSVIPGNHDVFGGAPNSIMFFTFQLICKNTNTSENVEKFAETFADTMPEDKTFPYLKVIDNIAFIGINSMDKWSVKNNPEGSNGMINKGDFKKLKKILSRKEIKDKYKIVLIHHHFNKVNLNEEYPAHSLWLKTVDYKMKLHNKNKLAELFKNLKVNLVLHGHTHINHIYNIKGVTYINSSAACVPLTDDMNRMYNIISIPGADETDRILTVETIRI